MTHERFNELLEENFDRIRQVLAKKQAEYNLDEDRLSHFKRAAAFAQTTPEKVLYGYMLKHLMSMSEMIASEQIFNKDLWDEKLGDILNYLFLLKGLLEDGQRYVSDELKPIKFESTKSVSKLHETK